MIILHGENLAKSRLRLVELLETAKNAGSVVTRVAGKQLTEAHLEQLLGETDLFGSPQLLVIEELHSLPKSKKKDALIATLAAANDADLILWEKRELTPTMLKKFPQAKVEVFKASNAVFAWLDQIGSHDKKKTLQLFHQALAKEDEYLCFIMFARQIRLLIQARETGRVAGPPFMQSKLKKQASQFSLEQLLHLHERLVQIDAEQKRSQSRLSISQQLDLLQLQL